MHDDARLYGMARPGPARPSPTQPHFCQLTPESRSQVKLFIELFTSKFQAYWFKILRAEDEKAVTSLAQEFEANLQVLSKLTLEMLYMSYFHFKCKV